MSNYESTPSPKSISESEREEIYEFFGNPGHVGSGTACPLCGAKISWSYLGAKNMITHIRWHANLSAFVSNKSLPYPGKGI